MKKVLLLAYTNHNFGDDMFIYTICQSFPEQQFVIYADKKYKQTFKNIDNLSIVKKNWLTRLYNKLLNKFPQLYKFNFNTIGYSAVVYVIGGLFNEDEHWNQLVDKYGIKRLKNMMWQNSYDSKTPFLLLGSNVAKVTTSNYIHQMEYLFNGLTDICFRDKYSYDTFKHMSNTRYAPDIVFNYNTKAAKKDDSILISIWGPLTSVDKFPQWEWAEYLWEPYKKFIIKLIEEFNNIDKKVILVSLCDNEGDLQACQEIKNECSLDNFDIVNYNGDLESMIHLFEKASFVVGSRFHSIIMALNSHCAFYPIIYESKTQQLLKDIGYQGPAAHIENIETYSSKNVMQNYFQNTKMSCNEVKNDARNQFHILQRFLNEE